MNRERSDEVTELDVTSFLNLMVVLVPMLLLSMALVKYQTINIEFDKTGVSDIAKSLEKNVILQVMSNDEQILVKTEEDDELFSTEPNSYQALNRFMFGLKKELLSEGKSASVIVSMGRNTSYQESIDTLAAISRYQLVSFDSIADAILFENVSFGE